MISRRNFFKTAAAMAATTVAVVKGTDLLDQALAPLEEPATPDPEAVSFAVKQYNEDRALMHANRMTASLPNGATGMRFYRGRGNDLVLIAQVDAYGESVPVARTFMNYRSLGVPSGTEIKNISASDLVIREDLPYGVGTVTTIVGPEFDSFDLYARWQRANGLMFEYFKRVEDGWMPLCTTHQLLDFRMIDKQFGTLQLRQEIATNG